MTVQAIRGAVRLNGVDATGIIDIEVDNNNAYQADTFTVNFDATKIDANWFSNQTSIEAEVFVGFPKDPQNYTSSDLTSLILGNVDHIDYDPTTCSLSITGRDLTSRFIDTKTVEMWANNTSSEIATLLANRRGLTPVVTKTTAKAGTYYKIDQVKSTMQRSEWDILAELARNEGFVCYVKGKELHFEPAPNEKSKRYTFKYIKPTAERGYSMIVSDEITGVDDIKFSRDLGVSKGVIVQVLTTGRKINKRGVSHAAAESVFYPQPGKAASIKAGHSGSKSNANIYRYWLQNKTKEEALKFAQLKHKELTLAEMRLTMELPCDDVLMPTMGIGITGTGTAFDQVYYPTSIKRSVRFEGGGSMTVEARNKADSTPEPTE